jgi:hypothetical protein
MCKDQPDNTGINNAAEAQAALSKESLDFYKQIYAEQGPMRERAANTAMQVADQQLASMKSSTNLAEEYAGYNRNTFRPLERGIVADAQAYDTPGKRDQAAGRAMADVGMQAQMAQQAQMRSQQRMGVNPNSGRVMAMQGQMGIAEAAAKAGAASSARDKVETIGAARKMDAASLGRGLASNQATSASLALNAGNSATNNAGVPLSQSSQSANVMGQGFNTSMQANNSAGNLYGQAAQVQGKDSGLMGALGGVAGQFAGSAAGSSWLVGLSDVNMKKDIKPVSDEAALKAVEDTPVSTWKYKDGAGDGGQHTGPMAQEVNKTMGEQAAPGGKKLDLITMNGVTMAGLAALSRKVDKLAKKLEGASA